MPKINDEKRGYNKQIILEFASELFNEKGYNNTSVNDIIKKANMSKGRFYTYYESKEELFFDIIHKSDREIRDIDSDFNEIDGYIEYRLKRFLKNENRIRAKYALEFWTSVSLTEHQKVLFDERYAAFQKDILSIIEKGQTSGIYSDNIPAKVFVHILMSSLDGLIMMDTVLNQPITDEIVKTTIKIFNGYLREAK